MALIREAVELTSDPAICVRAARCPAQGDFDVIEYACSNMRDTIEEVTEGR